MDTEEHGTSVVDGVTLAGVAYFSSDRRHRYLLKRTWDQVRRPLGFIMLNPSTADAMRFDPTVRRCFGYARAWQYGGLLVANLFSLRATHPREMLAAEEPTNVANDAALAMVAREAPSIVCGWGDHGGHRGRSAEVVALLEPYRRKLFALGFTKSGEPRHPLYLRRDAQPRPLFL